MKAAKVLRRLLLAALAGGLVAALYYGRLLDPALVRQLAAGAGDAAPILFVVGYALATVLFLPGSILTIAGGALFGPVAGTFYSLTGATLGATLAFLVARYLASDRVARPSAGRLGEFVRGVEAEGWRFVVFVRLVPLLPFNALNYALGLTRIPVSQYVAASYVAMLPGAAAYTYVGYAGREAFAGSDELMRHGLVALALLAAALFLPRLARRLRGSRVPAMIEIESLQRRVAGGEHVTIVDVRGADEYTGELGHIAGSLNIPLPDLPGRIPSLQGWKQQPLVLVCRTEKRSAKAAELLRAAGFHRVEVLRGGMLQWNARRTSEEIDHGKDAVRS